MKRAGSVSVAPVIGGTRSISKRTVAKSTSKKVAGKVKAKSTTGGKTLHTPGAELSYFKFEVTGKVQRVFFRKYTQKEAVKLGILGWVMNTTHGTVVGEAFGEPAALEKMKYFLQNTGSPKSRIEKCDFEGEGSTTRCDFTSFDIRR